MAVEDWQRAAAEVERRMSELRLTRAQLARMAEVDRKTVDNFLDRGMKPRTSTRGGYEAALLWRYGSLTDVARGGAAEVIDVNNPSPTEDSLSEDQVLTWLRAHLPPHLGDHIVNQYYILKAAAVPAPSESPPQDPIQGRGDAGARSTSQTLSPSPDNDDVDELFTR